MSEDWQLPKPQLINDDILKLYDVLYSLYMQDYKYHRFLFVWTCYVRLRQNAKYLSWEQMKKWIEVGSMTKQTIK